MVPAAVSSIIEALGKLILGFGLAFVAVKLTSDVLFASFAAVLGISLGSIISLLYIHIKYKSKNKLLPKDDSSANLKAVKKVIIITAVQIAFASLSNTFVGLIDTLTVRWQIANYTDTAFSSMLANYSSLVWEHNEILGTVSSKTDFATILYGIRSKAFTIFNLIPTLVISVGISAIPLLSADFSSGNKSKFNNRIFETLSLSSLIIFPASFGCIAVSKEISCLLYGMTPSSFLCGELLKIYGFAAIFAGLSIVFGCILQSMGEEKQAFINIVIALFTKLVLNSVWVNEADFNILGSAYATLVCFAVVFIRNLISLAKRMDFTLILKSVYKPFTAALVCIIPAMVITRHYSTNFAIILSVTVSAVVYLALLFAFKIISVSQVAKILKKPS